MTNRTEPQDGTLRTADPLRAAALVSFGIRLVDAVPDKVSSRLLFVFDDTDQAAREASSCFLQDRPVGIQTFITNLRKMRELIYQWRLTGREEAK